MSAPIALCICIERNVMHSSRETNPTSFSGTWNTKVGTIWNAMEWCITDLISKHQRWLSPQPIANNFGNILVYEKAMMAWDEK